MTKLVSFLKDESGASAAEYALILAIVGLGIVLAANNLKTAIGGAMNSAASCINTANSTQTSC
jgi:pilus assembly protein Flp/PilA